MVYTQSQNLFNQKDLCSIIRKLNDLRHRVRKLRFDRLRIGLFRMNGNHQRKGCESMSGTLSWVRWLGVRQILRRKRRKDQRDRLRVCRLSKIDRMREKEGKELLTLRQRNQSINLEQKFSLSKISFLKIVSWMEIWKGKKKLMQTFSGFTRIKIRFHQQIHMDLKVWNGWKTEQVESYQIK